MNPSRNTLFLSMCLLILASCSTKEAPPNVLLLIIDTVNAKHLGCYGYERNTSPFIDSLASSGIRYANCQAQAPWTLPGTATILTGLTERSHGCSRYGGVSHGLDPEVPTLASILGSRGYTTATFVNNGYLGPDFGLDRGYGSYWMGKDSIDYAHVTMDSAMHFLDTLATGRPFYLKLHLIDPHLPYDPPGPLRHTFQVNGNRRLHRLAVLLGALEPPGGYRPHEGHVRLRTPMDRQPARRLFSTSVTKGWLRTH